MPDAIDFRRAALKNGYRLVRVQSRGKRPIARGWERGETAEVLLAGDPAENTGLLLDGLRALDIDIDEAATASRALKVLTTLAPKTPLVRCRNGSTRFALIYRAAVASPRKRSIRGRWGGLDILGAGNQIVVDGLHPSGTRLDWRGGLSPATVPLDAVPTIGEEDIDRILRAVAPIIEAPSLHLTKVTPTGKPVSVADINAELSAGIGGDDWFSSLPTDKKADVVKTCLNSIDNTTSDPRERWLSVLFAVADAGNADCPNARQMALDWSRRGMGWTTEADFDLAWTSYKPGKVTVGTLFHFASASGLDLSPWRNGTPAIGINRAYGTALPINALPLNPPKREWLHGTDLCRGAVTLLVAPGGRGKSSWLTALSLAAASGKPLLGPHVFGGPLRVLYINCEDGTDELARRFRAAMSHHHLTDADLPGLMVAGADRSALVLLRSERNIPVLHEHGWKALESQIEHARPDIVIIDPLVAAMGGVSLNDNSAAALLMQRMVRLAVAYRCAVVVAHHTSKGSDIRNPDAAMGAASLVNLARIVLNLKTLSEADAPKIGVTPSDAAFHFSILGAKQNFSRPDISDRWFRLLSVELPNAQPPVYPHGDKVGVVEIFKPLSSTSAFPQADIQSALAAIAAASPPLSPSPNSPDYAVPVIAAALTQQRGNVVSDAEAKILLDHLIRAGLAITGPVQVGRKGRGAYSRNGLMVVGKLPSVQVTATPPQAKVSQLADPGVVAAPPPP